MNAARKYKNIRKKNKYASKSKSKLKPSNKRKQRNPHYTAVVIEKIGLETKQPNSGIRKCVRAQLISNGEMITAYIPYDGGSKWIDENDTITIQRYTKTIGDIPGVKYKVIKVTGRSLASYHKYGSCRCRRCRT